MIKLLLPVFFAIALLPQISSASSFDGFYSGSCYEGQLCNLRITEQYNGIIAIGQIKYNSKFFGVRFVSLINIEENKYIANGKLEVPFGQGGPYCIYDTKLELTPGASSIRVKIQRPTQIPDAIYGEGCPNAQAEWTSESQLDRP